MYYLLIIYSYCILLIFRIVVVLYIMQPVAMKRGFIQGIYIHRQEDTQWCYAAAIQSILEYYTHNITSQPDIVRNVTGSSTNSSPQDPHGILHEMDLIYNSYDGSYPSWETIREQIDAGRPIIVRLGADTGHYVIIIGYELPESLRSRKVGNNVVIYIDPMKSTLTYETGPDSNRMVTCECDGPIGEAPDEITGYLLTQPLPPPQLPSSRINKTRNRHRFKVKRNPKFHSIRKKYPKKSNKQTKRLL